MRATILTSLFQSEELKSLLGKMEPAHLRDDLRQELMLVLCELPEEKLLDLNNQGTLRFYAVRTVLNMIQSKTSRFYKKFRLPVVEWKDIQVADDLEDPAEKEYKWESLVNSVRGEIDELHWYEKGILEAYIEKGSSYKVQKETGIPRQSVMVTVNKSIQTIKSKINRA